MRKVHSGSALSTSLAASALAAAMLASGAASAETLSPGIVYDAASGYHVVTIDLDSDATEVRVAATHANRADDVVPVSTHGRQEGATVAINANFFGGYPANYTCGLARGFGATFSDGYSEPGNCSTSLGWTRGAASLFDSAGHEHDGAFMPAFTDVVTGGGILLQGGAPHDWNHAKLEAGRDCTAVGVSADRKHFVMVVTDSTACSGGGLQSALAAHGAADAIHLDGGGSSKMWIRGKGYVNNEVEDRSPPVAIVARPNGACPSDCGATSSQCVELDKPFRAQCVAQACRAGLSAVWNCDVDKKRRVSCQGGVVAKEYCAQGCKVNAINTDDECIGGAIPEPAAQTPAPPATGAAPPATTGGATAAPSAGATDAPPPDASAGSGGCSAAPGRARTPSGPSAPVTAIAIVVLVALVARSRRRGGSGGGSERRSAGRGRRGEPLALAAAPLARVAPRALLTLLTLFALLLAGCSSEVAQPPDALVADAPVTPPATPPPAAATSCDPGTTWTCDGTKRARCDAREACDRGCYPHAHEDAACNAAAPSWSCDHSAYKGTQYWTCSAGGLYRCDAQGAVTVACAKGCSTGPLGTDDACKEDVNASAPPPGYLLPLACDSSVSITQGNNSPFSHNGLAAYAFDFGIPRGTPLLAVEDGTVLMTKNDVRPGNPCWSGGGSGCANTVNYVVLDHGDGTASLYLHLDSATVAVGAKVKRGEQVGLSGGTGWSTGPHAHVQRQSLCGSWWCQSVPMSFADVAGSGVPVTGDVVSSKNGC